MGAFAWPAAVLILGLVFLFLFKKPIDRLLDRTERIGKEGIQAVTRRQEEAIADSTTKKADEFMKLFDNALLVQREEALKAQLEAVLGKDPTDRERVLVRLLAANTIAEEFERNYYLIFGSQIAALVQLNTAGAVGIEMPQIEAIFSQAAQRHPDIYKDAQIADWLSFLLRTHLVHIEVNKAYITPVGKEFLKYLIHQGYSLLKLA
jgi:hypothetical protein